MDVCDHVQFIILLPCMMGILLILFYNVFKTLKGEYMLNLTSLDKTSEILFCLQVQLLQTWLSVHLSAYISIIISYCMGISLLIRPVDQQQRQLAVRFYSKWYYAISRIDVLAWRFRLASNRSIVCGSANIRLCQVQAMISNDLFE